jgi:hypothetical protein
MLDFYKILDVLFYDRLTHKLTKQSSQIFSMDSRYRRCPRYRMDDIAT